MRLYLAGRMRGAENFGFPVFDDARDQLAGQGFDVVSPADIDRKMGWVYEQNGQVYLTDGFEFEMAMDRDLAELAACDAIVLLPGWNDSEGANRELVEARRLGKRIYWYEAGRIEELREPGAVFIGGGRPQGNWPNPAGSGGATLNGPEKPAVALKPKAAPKPPEVGRAERELPERAQVLRTAEELTCGDRNVSYGEPTADFRRIAALWSILFERTFTMHEVAMAMACLKLSRLTWSPGSFDSWCDLAGYAATGWETVVAEEKERRTP